MLHNNSQRKSVCVSSRIGYGAGTMNVARHVRTLKASGYDGKITLEVFTDDRRYLALSRGILRRIWDAASAVQASTQPGVPARAT